MLNHVKESKAIQCEEEAYLRASKKSSNLSTSTEGSSDSFSEPTEFEVFINNKRSMKAPFLL